MLYVTTASKHDTFTAHYTLCHDRAKDGGLFVPYQMPKLSAQEVDSLSEKSFGQRVADILNLFFSSRLNGWDVDCSIGRKPAKLVSMSNRILIAETWHNLDWNFAGMVRNLSNLLLAKGYTGRTPSNWAWTAVRIAALFGIFGELKKVDFGSKIDFAVPAGDFSVPFAVWYAREMGLPVGTIVVSGSENSGVWDLLHQGQMRMDSACSTGELERLIFCAAGFEAAQNFRNVCSSGKVYIPEKPVFDELRKGMTAAVVSPRRTEAVIRNVYRDNTYIMETDTALAYSGLQDHLARTKETSAALILSEKNPVCSCETVAGAMGISTLELKNRLDII